MGLNSRKRKEKLKNIISGRNELTVGEITRRFRVSEATARRDLAELEKQGYITRTYGGAVSQQGKISFEYFFREKRKKNVREKKLIAGKAVQMIKEGDTVFIDSGSTTWLMAKALCTTPKRLKDITILTNSLAVCWELGILESLKLILLGGTVRMKLADVCGMQAQANMQKYSVDKAFLGVDGISAEKGLTTTDSQTANIEKQVISNSKEVIVLADNTKVGRISFISYADIREVSVLVTDDKADNKEIKRLRNSGLDVIVAL